jgi:dihydroorotase
MDYLQGDLLIRHSHVLLPTGELKALDVLIGDGKIRQLGENLAGYSGRELDATGLTILPGVIDPQVHFREPGLEHKEDFQTATYACVKGGVTSFLEMPNTKPLTVDQATLDDKLDRGRQKCLANYGFFIGATAYNLDQLNVVQPCCGIKIFMGSMKGDLLIDQDELLERIFAHGDRLIAVHAEDQKRINQRRAELLSNLAQPHPALHSQIQDDQAALLATQKAVHLSLKYRRRLHILHLSTKLEVDYLREYKAPWITAEVTPQHLFLNTDAYQTLGTLAQMNPPLRSAMDNAALWEGLHTGILDCIATDHAPHTLEEKAQPYPHSPSGMPGVETALPLMLTAAMEGKCSLHQVSNWMSRNVAIAYAIPRKGEIRVGWDADLVLVDLREWKTLDRRELQTKCGWSPFEGWKLTGYPQYTIVNGWVVYDRGKFYRGGGGKPLQFSSFVVKDRQEF